MIDPTPIPARGWHTASLAPRLRQADKDEIENASGNDPFKGLALSVARSDVSYSFLANGIPEIMCGAAKVIENSGVIWMLASSALEDCPMAFLRRSNTFLDRLHDETGCEVLSNYTDKQNTVHHKWLRWTGFQFHDETLVGPNQMPFYPITRVRKNVRH